MTPLTQIHADGRVAERYGLEEAIFLHALMFWYRTNRGNNQNFHDGRWWTYNSVKAFEEIFPWWTAGQIRRVIARCKEKGAMLTGSFAEDRRDRTAWYTPSDELLMLYGENVNCICTNQQMQEQEPASSDAEIDKCNIRNTWGNHGETDMTPYSPPPGDGVPAGAEPEGKPAPEDKPSSLGIAPDRASCPGRAGHYRRGAAGGAGAQCLAGAGYLGLLGPVGESLGPNLPAVHRAVVSAGRAGDCGL